MKYAFNDNGILRDVVMTHPSILFSKSYADQFIEVPDNAENGFVWDGVYATSPVNLETLEQKSKSVREHRNYLLSLTDWTQLPDSPVDKQSWADYRQALRDIPQKEDFPNEVNWPVEPV